MNEEQTTEQPVADRLSEDQPPTPVRNEPQAPDQRRRLRELLAIPEHQRTDAIWDEIIELEICLAPGNRVQGSPGAQQETGRRQGSGQGRRPEQARRQDPMPGVKPPKRFFKKSKRPPGSPPKTGG
jgi:hypothetical protein